MISNIILTGDALPVLKTMTDSSVQCCVTSPPYWGLRDYGHEGQLGLEKTPEEYVSKMVEIFREVKRVLRKDGTLWLNLGDSYAGSGRGRDADGEWNPGKGGSKQETNVGAITGRSVNPKSLSMTAIRAGAIGNAWVKPPEGLKPKDLVGIPWRVAFALQADGWWLRQDIIWHKPKPMPESVTDRCTKSHEYIFLLTKSAKYYYDGDAIKEPCLPESMTKLKADIDLRNKRNGSLGRKSGQFQSEKIGAEAVGLSGGKYLDGVYKTMLNGANKRSVWSITLKSFDGAHFATFPEELPTLCIKAGSKSGDVILDPFAGSGTTLEVAKRLGRNYIGIELNEKYVKTLIEPRLQNISPLFNAQHP